MSKIISSDGKNKVLGYCNIGQYSNSCKLNGNGINNYNSFSFYNLFCTENLTNHTYFQETYLEKYSKFFRNIPNSNEFCGQEMYVLDSVQNSFSIINKSNKNIQNSKINHCNYEINNTKYFNNQLDKINLIIKYNINNPEKKNLKFIFNILLQNSSSKLSKLMTINEMDLIKEQYKIGLNDYDKIILLFDFNFDIKNNLDTDEYIEIKIDFDKFNSKKNEIKKCTIVVIVSILGVSILISINIIYYKRKKNREIQIQTEILHQKELIRKQKEEKINKLLETILISKEFNEKDIINDCIECTICLEKFVDKCLICITPCKHIFHYECLRNLIESIKRTKKPTFKCPLCKYDFLEENWGKKLKETNNINDHTNHIEVNNIEVNNNIANNNEGNNNVNNINENNNNNENNVQQNNFRITSRRINVISSRYVATSEENLRERNI